MNNCYLGDVTKTAIDDYCVDLMSEKSKTEKHCDNKDETSTTSNRFSECCISSSGCGENIRALCKNSNTLSEDNNKNKIVHNFNSFTSNYKINLEDILGKIKKNGKVILGTICEIIQLLFTMNNDKDTENCDFIHNEIEELIIVNTNINIWNSMNDIISYMIKSKENYNFVFENIKIIRFINNEFPWESKIVSLILDWLFLFIINDKTILYELYFESCIFILDSQSFNNFKKRRVNMNGDQVVSKDINENNDEISQNDNVCLKRNNEQDQDYEKNSHLINGLLKRIFNEDKFILKRFTIKNMQLNDYQVYKILNWLFNCDFNDTRIEEIIIDRIYNNYCKLRVTETVNDNHSIWYYKCIKSNISNIISNINNSCFDFGILNKISFSNNNINTKEASNIFNYITLKKCNISDNNELFIDFSNNFITEDFFLHHIKRYDFKVTIDVTGNPLEENGVYSNKNKYINQNIYVICEYLFPKEYYNDILNCSINYDSSILHSKNNHHTFIHGGALNSSYTYNSICMENHQKHSSWNTNNCHSNSSVNQCDHTLRNNSTDNGYSCCESHVCDICTQNSNNLSPCKSKSSFKCSTFINSDSYINQQTDDSYESEDDEDYEYEEDDESSTLESDEDKDCEVNNAMTHRENRSDSGKPILKEKGNDDFNTNNRSKFVEEKVEIVQEEDVIESLISETRENHLRLKISQEKWM